MTASTLAISSRELDARGIASAVPAALDLVVVDPDVEARTRLAVQLGDAGGVATYSEVAALADCLRPGRPTVVVFGPSLDSASGLAQIELVTRSRPELGAIMVVTELSTRLLQQALRSGVRDVVDVPGGAESLRESVDRVARTLVAVPPVVEGGPQPAGRGRVITVSSTKGGSGKSVIATNLAVALAGRSDRPVALVDADLQFGDVAVLLRLPSSHTMADAVSSIDRLDAHLLRSMLVRHEPSGLMVLPAPTEPSFAHRVTGADVVGIVEVLQSFCDYVVVDTPAQFDDVVLALIDHSDDVIVVTGLDLPSVKNAKLGLRTLQLLSVPESKVQLLVNRANSRVELDIGDVERTLGLRADSLIPSDVVVPRSVNLGVPVVIGAPRSAVARAFQELADRFSPRRVDGPSAKGRRRFGLF